MADELRILEITDGQAGRVVHVAANAGYAVPFGGMGLAEIIPHSHDQSALSLEDIITLETWSILIFDQNADAIDQKVSLLADLLRQSWLYWNAKNGQFLYRPVYLIERAQCETNSRYALIREAPQITMPRPVYNMAFEVAQVINDGGLQLSRYAWREGLPETMGTAITLDETDGPADPLFVQVVNSQDETEIDTIYRYDASLTSYSANLFGSDHDVWPTTPPAVGDQYLIGAEEPFWHYFAEILTRGNPVGLTYDVKFSIAGPGWSAAMTIGEDFTEFPESNPFGAAAGQELGFNFLPDDTWAKVAVNATTKYWIKIEITAITTYATMTEVGNDYTPKTPEIRIPANTFNGDISPLLLLRLKHPYGTDDESEYGATSRIIVGLRQETDLVDLDEIVSQLICASDNNPAGWALTLDTDAAYITDERNPNAQKIEIDFAGETTMVRRFYFEGSDKLLHYTGNWKVFLICHTDYGYSEGEINVQLVAKINSDGDDAPAIPYPEQSPKWDDTTGLFEIIDLTKDTTMKLPFADTNRGDDYDGANVIFEIYAEQVTGSSSFYAWKLVFIPADEWIADLNDPISNNTTGNSALRGYTLLDIDNGLVALRTIKQIIDDSGEIVPAETWSRRSEPMKIDPAREARLYFLIASYTGGGWGTASDPTEASPMAQVQAEIYHQDRFLYLRGDR